MPPSTPPRGIEYRQSALVHACGRGVSRVLQQTGRVAHDVDSGRLSGARRRRETLCCKIAFSTAVPGIQPQNRVPVLRQPPAKRARRRKIDRRFRRGFGQRLRVERTGAEISLGRRIAGPHTGLILPAFGMVYDQRVAYAHLSAETHDPQEPVDETKYTHLKLDLKYLGQRPYMHIRGLGRQVDLGDELLEARAMSASVQQRGRDAYGQIEYDSYVERDTRVTRRLVLTSEGYLVVQDEITAGRSADGWTAGQLWQLYEWKRKERTGSYRQATGLIRSPLNPMELRRNGGCWCALPPGKGPRPLSRRSKKHIGVQRRTGVIPTGSSPPLASADCLPEAKPPSL